MGQLGRTDSHSGYLEIQGQSLSFCFIWKKPHSTGFPGEGNGNPFQYSCLKNPVDRGPWQATVYGVTELDITEQLRTNLPLEGLSHVLLQLLTFNTL